MQLVFLPIQLEKWMIQECKNIIVSGQGVHIVLDKSFLPGDSAIMVPETDDGRVLFAIPWHDYILVGTTDTPVDEFLLEPIPMEEEIEFLLIPYCKIFNKRSYYEKIF